MTRYVTRGAWVSADNDGELSVTADEVFMSDDGPPDWRADRDVRDSHE